MKPPYFDFSEVRRRHEQRTGTLCGFTRDGDRSRFPHAVMLHGLCRDDLGGQRFAFVLNRCLRAAARIAPCAHRSRAVYEDHRMVGHEFWFENQIHALRLHLCFMAAMAYQPCPSLELAEP